MGDVLNTFVFPEVEASYDANHENLVWFSSPQGHQIPAMLTLPSQVWTAPQEHVEKEGIQIGQVAAVCVIFFHANRCDIGETKEFVDTVQERVFNGAGLFLCPEYPGYGLLGEFASSAGAIDQVAQAAWLFCRDALGFSHDQIVIWGHSIGCGPATRLALSAAAETVRPQRRNVREQPSNCGCLVLMAANLSISEVARTRFGSMVGMVVPEMWDTYNIVAREEMADTPLCLVHPVADEVVPLDHSMQLLSRSASREKVGLWLPNEGHNFELNGPYLEDVSDFVFSSVPALRQAADAACSDQARRLFLM